MLSHVMCRRDREGAMRRFEACAARAAESALLAAQGWPAAYVDGAAVAGGSAGRVAAAAAAAVRALKAVEAAGADGSIDSGAHL